MFASWYDFKISVVRMFTKSEYSHVGLAFVIGEGIGRRVFILESVMPCVRLFPVSNLKEDFYWLPLKSRWNSAITEIAFSKIGKPYSQLSAMQAFFETLPEDSVSECAAYVVNVCKAAGLDLGPRATPDAVVLKAQMIPGVETIYVSYGE